MIDFAIVQFKLWVVGFIWENYWSFWTMLWGWSVAHPIQAPFVWFSMFAVTFAGYSTLRRMMDDGSLASLHWTQKATILSVFAIPGIHAYLIDIFVLRLVFVWVFAQVPPYYQDWKFLSASWTFSRWVWLFKDRTAGAKWWNGLLHAVEPRGH